MCVTIIYVYIYVCTYLVGTWEEAKVPVVVYKMYIYIYNIIYLVVYGSIVTTMRTGGRV